MMTDPISDMLTRIRNAALVRKQTIDVPHSKMKFALAKVLQAEKFISDVQTVEAQKGKALRLTLQFEGGKSVITAIRRVSTPGRRVYVKNTALPNIRSGQGIAVISTPNGLMTNREARKRRLGGEVICEIF